MKNSLLLLLLTACACSLTAQSTPKMLRITGGTTTLGGGYNYAISGYSMVLLGRDEAYETLNANQTTIGEIPAPNAQSRRVTIADFMLAETEVTNAQYQAFLLDSLFSPTERIAFQAQLKAEKRKEKPDFHALWLPVIQKASAANILPDTSCWINDFQYAYNRPLEQNYHWHPAFSEYPVVGVTWEQAHAYCDWLTHHTNEALAAKGKPLQPAFRLPTEAEWEYAGKAVANPKSSEPIQPYLYAWPGRNLIDDHGRYLLNIKTAPGDYIGDNYEYTAPVKAHGPYANGLYAMCGNVSEWCEDVFRFEQPLEDLGAPQRNRIQLFEAADVAVEAVAQRVVKGGSWADYCYAAQAGSRMGWPQTRGSSRIGFRVAQIIAGDAGDKPTASR